MCTCCFGSIENESCGWPKGTVRAVVALTTIPLGFLSTLVIMIILVLKEEYTIALGVNSVIWGVIGTIIGHYFGSRTAEGAAEMISRNGHELIESRNLEINNGLYRKGNNIDEKESVNEIKTNNDYMDSEYEAINNISENPEILIDQ